MQFFVIELVEFLLKSFEDNDFYLLPVFHFNEGMVSPVVLQSRVVVNY